MNMQKPLCTIQFLSPPNKPIRSHYPSRDCRMPNPQFFRILQNKEWDPWNHRITECLGL